MYLVTTNKRKKIRDKSLVKKSDILIILKKIFNFLFLSPKQAMTKDKIEHFFQLCFT